MYNVDSLPIKAESRNNDLYFQPGIGLIFYISEKR